jgi:hypothetical protein
MEDSPEEAGAVVTRADRETSKQRNLDPINPGATRDVPNKRARRQWRNERFCKF